jgi:hypothetical protein
MGTLQPIDPLRAPGCSNKPFISDSTQRMFNSFEIAEVLRQHDFKSLTDVGRTKAHGYQHPRMTHPVYVKMAGPAGNLKPVGKAPLVIRHDDGLLLEGYR